MAAWAAKAASLEPSVASRIFVGKAMSLFLSDQGSLLYLPSLQDRFGGGIPHRIGGFFSSIPYANLLSGRTPINASLLSPSRSPVVCALLATLSTLPRCAAAARRSCVRPPSTVPRQDR